MSDFQLKKSLFLGFIAIYLIRFFISAYMGIMPQDAYYTLYSEHLDFSYFDHPPMIAYIIRLATTLFGKSVVVLKLTDFIVSLGAFIGFYYLSSLFLSQKRALYAAIFYGSTLQLTILSINTTPDVALLFFWTITLIVLYKAVYQHKLYLWALSGFLMGLSFDSKYTGLFLLFGLFLFLLFSKEHRHLLFSKQMLITLLVFFITISPVVYWNFAHDWISFTFQTTKRASSIGKFSLKPNYFLGHLGVQIMLLLPFLFFGLVFTLYRLVRKFIRKRFLGTEIKFLLAFSAPMIGFFFFVSLFYWVKLNWIMPGYLAAIILTSIYIRRKLIPYQVVTALVLHVLLFIQVKFYIVNIKSDDTWFGWEQLANRVKQLKQQDPNSFVFSDDEYKTSAVLNFYMDEHVYAGNVLGDNALQFSIIDSDLNHLAHRDAYYIDSEKNFKNRSKSNAIPTQLKDHFDQVIELEPIIIENARSVPVRKFRVFKCLGYKGKVDDEK